MLEPPDLQSPFVNDDQRGEALSKFLVSCGALRQWYAWATSGDLPAELAGAMGDRTAAGDTPALMLGRWRSLFEEELQAVFDSRNRLVHGVRLSDQELKGAAWLADQLLRLIDPATAA